MKGAIWIFGERIFQAEGTANTKSWHIEGAARKIVWVEHSERGGLREEVREVPGEPVNLLGHHEDFSFYAGRNGEPVKAFELCLTYV